MKKWEITFTLNEGGDEFYEANPSYAKIEQFIRDTLDQNCVDIENLRVVKFTDIP